MDSITNDTTKHPWKCLDVVLTAPKYWSRDRGTPAMIIIDVKPYYYVALDPSTGYTINLAPVEIVKGTEDVVQNNEGNTTVQEGEAREAGW